MHSQCIKDLQHLAHNWVPCNMRAAAKSSSISMRDSSRNFKVDVFEILHGKSEAKVQQSLKRYSE